MSINLTENAADHVKKMLEQRQHGIGLRLGTKKSGCTGFAYVVDYADTVEENDRVFDSRGIKVVVDTRSLPMLDGLTLDFVRENVLNEGFEFINPNVKEQCGCGESFNV
ncbi:MAG: iron-sulfur cluster assembly accessory protein [Gammaproteobacteria bacterium]|nr:iron-sulfur cluster assembly accessory protein [Gammaproteobacteria bacterium]